VTRRRSCTIAVGDGAGEWFLGNAGPDLDAALRECAALWPGVGESAAPIHGVFLTDAELDHILGLLSLRQAGELHVYATVVVRDMLTRCGVLPTLESYTVIHWHEVRPGEQFALRYRDGTASPIWCEPFDASCGRLPRYARGSVAQNGVLQDGVSQGGVSQGGGPDSGTVIGYRVTDQRTARSMVFLPSVAALSNAALKHINQAHLTLVDGTFWVDDEMSQHGRGTATARSMGHLPVSGANGSLRLLGQPTGTQTGNQVVYTHINNTNPMLFEDGPERAFLASTGASIAEDGSQYEL
jgi:pyrroloquinoline quinone biosynthesis protein B